ncbi:hypothetical protein OKJ48_38770 [Streptomyces kunmingensis]|uniref:Uncharacterized protein n=1 Tax=Streptomyces kunmingensis TaxID=68225 RepID=A0ABU6CN59_9ACTN|nr:hypothetical protein [Streptomyces kunmingensis]MEB3966127.1 hypothetical protein [Streptomyces kunmingensis]
MGVFGVLAAVMGIVGLTSPGALIKMMGFAAVPDAGRGDGDHTVVFLTASSMAALNMGVYYVLAAASDWTAFFRWTVPFRLVTCTVFTLAVLGDRAPAGFIGVGLWEGLGAVATAVALRADKRRAVRSPESPAAATAV